MDRRISEISDDMAGIDGIGDCDEKSFSPSGRCSDICTSAKAETHFDRDCRSFNDCFLMYYDIFRVQSSTVYDGSDVSGDADSGGALMIMEQLLTFIERLKNKNAPEEPREFID